MPSEAPSIFLVASVHQRKLKLECDSICSHEQFYLHGPICHKCHLGENVVCAHVSAMG